MKRDGPSLTYSAYVTAGWVRRSLTTRSGRRAAIRHMAYMGITKAYLEAYRGGLLLDDRELVVAREGLEEAGIQTSGGIATTHGAGATEKSTHGAHWACFSSERTLDSLEAAARTAARIFDEVIVDDFVCTACRCPRCRERKGHKGWSEYYKELMLEYVVTRLIEPAREENPEVRLIVKYPQWYDRFHVFGYDVVPESKASDAVWVGTEIRDPNIDYVHQYEPFANYTYLRSVAGDKVEGAWFDFLWCYPELYLEQAYQSILAGARELVLFSYAPTNYSRKNPNASALVERATMLERMASALEGKAALGIEAYKPPGSDPGSESFIYDYLGMLGLPVLVSSARPSTPAAILPQHSLSDPGIDKFITSRAPGDVLLATSGLLEGFKGRVDVLDLFGLSEDPVGRKEVFSYRFSVKGTEGKSEERVLFRSYLRPRRAMVLAEVVGGRRYPILTLNEEEGRSYLSAALDTFRYMRHHGNEVTVAEPVSLVHLPRSYLDLLRGILLDPMGIGFRAPSKVGLYLYSDQPGGHPTSLVIDNFRDQEVSVEVSGIPELRALSEFGEITHTENEAQVRLPRREILLLERS